MRFARALEAAPMSTALALAVAAFALTVRKVAPHHLSEGRTRLALLLAFLCFAMALLAAALRRLPPLAGSLALDRHHRLAGRLTNAVCFIGLPRDARTPLMEAAIEDAAQHAGRLSPVEAVPLVVPRGASVALLLLFGVATTASLEVRTRVAALPPHVEPEGLAMSPDDLELFREASRSLAQKESSPELRAAVDRFNQLIEDIAQKRLDRSEAFRRMEAIERELLKGEAADAKRLQAALSETARDLDKSALAKPLSEALAKGDLERAKQALRELSKRIEGKEKGKPEKAELERLQKALAQAAARRKEAVEGLEAKRAELEEELRDKRQRDASADAGASSARDQDELRKKERELERLDREREQQERVARELERLDREIRKAAEDLLRDSGMSAEDLKRAAEGVEEMQREQMTQQEKEELRQRLQELKELLRQQGKGGKPRLARMMRFGKRAQGEGERPQGESGEPGEGSQSEPSGEGKDGPGKSGPAGGQRWVLGPSGQKVLTIGLGAGAPMPSGAGDEGSGPAHGPGQGAGHDGNVDGKATNSAMRTQDVEAHAVDAQSGPTNSEVILSAAEKGFRGQGYKKVFTQYHTVAEAQIGKDDIPDGYRFYVRRYFQLIRPRE